MARVCTHCDSPEFVFDLCRESEEITIVTDTRIITFSSIPGFRCKQCGHFFYLAEAIKMIKKYQVEGLEAVSETDRIDMNHLVQEGRHPH